MLLKDLEIGKSSQNYNSWRPGALRQHFLDYGCCAGEPEIKLMKLAPMGDPMEFRIHGYELTLRVADAEKIEIEDISYSDSDAAGEEKLRSKKSEAEHPGLGEGGIYHVKTDGLPLPEGEVQ